VGESRWFVIACDYKRADYEKEGEKKKEEEEVR
jgi:hypothetical protein